MLSVLLTLHGDSSVEADDEPTSRRQRQPRKVPKRKRPRWRRLVNGSVSFVLLSTTIFLFSARTTSTSTSNYLWYSPVLFAIGSQKLWRLQAQALLIPSPYSSSSSSHGGSFKHNRPVDHWQHKQKGQQPRLLAKESLHCRRGRLCAEASGCCGGDLLGGCAIAP